MSTTCIEPKFLNTKGAAEFFNVSVETIKRWAKEYGLPHMKITSNTMRFDVEKLREWAEQREARL